MPGGFQLIPAVDVLDGRAVRLEKGDFDAVAREAGDPIELAKRFTASRPPFLHVVVLHAARDGGAPIELTRRLASAIAPVPLQLGGGVRTPADAFALFGAGAARVIVGTAAFEQGPEPYVDALGDRLVVAVDARDGEVRTRGWEQGSRLALDGGHDVVQSGRFPVLDVHADLRVPRARQVEAERADARKAAVAFTDGARDRTRRVDIGVREVHVERDQRATGADDDAARR